MQGVSGDQRGDLIDRSKIVDGHQLQSGAVPEDSDECAADAADAVDGEASTHDVSLNSLVLLGRGLNCISLSGISRRTTASQATLE